MKNIDVSIVMITWSPTDKRLNVLKKSLESLQASTKRPHLLVVVDNGPKEQTEWLWNQHVDIHYVNEVNQGVGKSRNIGAAATDTEYIAFVDNDILYFDNWLNECVGVLQRFDEKLIATPRKSSPMKHKKHHTGDLDGYELYNRASGQALVMKRETYNEIGWSERNTPGGIFCDSARRHGYRFIYHKDWKAKHLCRKASYNYRNRLVNGIWESK